MTIGRDQFEHLTDKVATSDRSQSESAWQLRLFQKTLKKKQKLKLLVEQLGHPDAEDRLLLLTNGDNNGALNYHFRSLGGRWSWGEMEESSLAEMRSLLHDPVVHCTQDRLGFADNSFDVAIVIDVHEHLEDCTALNREIFRVLKPGGRAIVTTPNGDTRKLAVRIKHWLGMTKEVYGHVREGYTLSELRDLMSPFGFQPNKSGSYSN